MTNHQTFTDPDAGTWLRIDRLPGVELMPLAQPVPDGSIHRARLVDHAAWGHGGVRRQSMTTTAHHFWLSPCQNAELSSPAREVNLTAR